MSVGFYLQIWIDYDFRWHGSHRVFSAEVPEIRPLVSETRLFFRTTKFRPLANLLDYHECFQNVIRAYVDSYDR